MVELKGVKYFKEITESREVFGTQANIYDGAFLWILNGLLYSQ